MIPVAVPNLGKREEELTVEALRSGHVGPQGPFVEQFEDMVSRAANREWAVATLTGTMAIEVTMGVFCWASQDGDDPDFAVPVEHMTWPAAFNAMTRLGIPREVRLGFEGMNHDYCYYRMPLRPFPDFCDMAPAIGEDRSTATIDVYSFAANKTVTCGAGGAICGDDPSLLRSIRVYLDQGHWKDGVINGRLSNISAAVGVAQMERLEELRYAKKAIQDRYADALPINPRGSSCWMSTLYLSHETVNRPVSRDDFEALRGQTQNAGFDIRHEPWGDVSLPCSTGLKELDQMRVIKFFKTFLGRG